MLRNTKLALRARTQVLQGLGRSADREDTMRYARTYRKDFGGNVHKREG